MTAAAKQVRIAATEAAPQQPIGERVDAPATAAATLLRTLSQHWPEYLIEAGCLAVFMVAACLCVALVEHPASPLRSALADDFLRRSLIGLAMGATAVGIVYSPWGKRSGAHLNPAVTLTFLRLGRVDPRDAAWYVLAQFSGGVLGVGIGAWLLGPSIIADPAVDYVVTRPGAAGIGAAFAAEAAISFGLMLAVLVVSNRRDLNRHTGLVAGALVAVYIAFEAPLSGMSMNPARSFGSAWSASSWDALWIYFAAPLAGMLIAAECYLRTHGHGAVLCCKIHHDNDQRCIFRCRYGQSPPRACAAPAADSAVDRARAG
jgi:aquaporin Z